MVTFLVNNFRLAASNLCVYKYAALVLLKLAEYWRNLSPWRCHADRWLFYYKCLHLWRPKNGIHVSQYQEMQTKTMFWSLYLTRIRERICRDCIYSYTLSWCTNRAVPGRQGLLEFNIYNISNMDKSILCCARGNLKVRHISVFIIVLIETEKISQNNCVTKKIYFAMFPAAHYKQSPLRSEYGLLGHWALQVKDQFVVF